MYLDKACYKKKIYYITRKVLGKTEMKAVMFLNR